MLININYSLHACVIPIFILARSFPRKSIILLAKRAAATQAKHGIIIGELSVHTSTA